MLRLNYFHSNYFLYIIGLLFLSGCGSSGGNGNASSGNTDQTSSSHVSTFTVTTIVGNGGSIDHSDQTVVSGSTASFVLTADTGYTIDSVSGCGGSLLGGTYTTAEITEDCTVNISFRINRYTVSTGATTNGAISPTIASVDYGSAMGFTIIPDGGFDIDAVSGCGGSLVGTVYTTEAITADCTINATFSASGGGSGGSVAEPSLSFVQMKTFRFTWSDISGATHYKLMENPNGHSGFSQVGADIPQGTQSFDHVVPLYARVNAEYILQTCDAGTCTDSTTILVNSTMVNSIGYIKASNTSANDEFSAYAVSLSGDGSTLAVGAHYEDSNATGIGGNQNDNSSSDSGAVYIFVRNGNSWVQQEYIKASNADSFDYFGRAISLSNDGNTLAVGAHREDSNATGINGNQASNSLDRSGAVYIYNRNGNVWTQQAYVKASNSGQFDHFGWDLSLSSDGNTLAVGAQFEYSSATGINGNQADNTAAAAGAVYVFSRTGVSWSQQAYIKASNTETGDEFGRTVSLSADGNTLAVCGYNESSNAQGVNNDEGNNLAGGSGAVYVFTRAGAVWSQQAYVKASNTNSLDRFGISVRLNSDGNTMAVGAFAEGSIATGIGGNQADNSAAQAGAVYIFNRVGVNWGQQAYIKASNTESGDYFGTALSLSGDGNNLIVGATGERSTATGVSGDQTDNSGGSAGAVYVFTRSGIVWSQQAYVKASNTGVSDIAGGAVSLSMDAQTMAVGAYAEASNATGVNGDQGDDTMGRSGAVYIY